MFQRILVVCVGNICRSPTAEFVFRRRLEGKKTAVSSAGLGALAGHPMDPLALELMDEHGLDGRNHIARQIDAAMIRESDLILVMERAHAKAITDRAPHALGRTFLLGKWQDDREVPDPYRRPRPAFERAYGLIDDSVAGWIPYL